MRLSFETTTDHQVHICLDEEGLSQFRKFLDRVQANGHVSLYTEAWGGNELTEEWASDKRSAVHHVKIAMGDPDDLYLRLAGR